MPYSDEAMALHRAMIDLGEEKESSDVIAALALTVAYAIKYHAMSEVPGAAAFMGLVQLELRDPNSPMCKPENE